MNMARYRIRPYSLVWCIVGSAKLLMGIGLMYLNIILLSAI